MRKLAFGFSICSLVALMIAPSYAATKNSIRQGPRPIKPNEHGVGRQIPNLSFTDIAGKAYQLSDFADQKAVVIAMTGTGCPLCLKYAPSLAAIEQEYRERGVTFVFVNPNASETIEEIRDAVQTHQFTGPYIQNGARDIPTSLGARTTTEVFVLDGARTLVYRGAVDDQYGIGYANQEPRKRYLADSLDALLGGRTPRIQSTTSPGCELFFDDSDKPSVASVELTYHNRISRIIQAHCLECHREGGIAPMPLESYRQVKDYAAMIHSVVVDREVMPPWFAAKQPDVSDEEIPSLHWANDRSMSEQDKRDLQSWIKSGAVEGDPGDAPLPRTFPGGWLIGKPDKVYEFSRPIPIKATGIMPYKNVTIETHLPEDRWVQAIEIRPGKLDVVHHVIVSVQSPDGQHDERDGYWGAYVPGTSTLVYPGGYARRLPKNAKLRFQMHYTPNGKATEDSTRIGVIFAKEPPQHEVKVKGIANGDIKIPPFTKDHKESASYRVPRDIQVLAFLPHMHLRGQMARYEVDSDAGIDLLLDIPRYDFNWQLRYQLVQPQTLHSGDTIRFTGWFDNSDNPANPAPEKTIYWGQQTEDEMLIGYVEYIVPGVKPSGSVSQNDVASEVRIEGREYQTAALIDAIRKLDRNGDGELVLAEVPRKHRPLFHLLDANDDDVLTVEEARASIRAYASKR